jgi:hypothetical protein
MRRLLFSANCKELKEMIMAYLKVFYKFSVSFRLRFPYRYYLGPLPPASYPVGTRGFIPVVSGRSMKLTTQLHLETVSRMRGAIIPLPQYVVIPWRFINQWMRVHGVVLS